MTSLIQSQAATMIVMLYCGMTIAIVYDVFTLFLDRFLLGKNVLKTLMRLGCYVVIAFIIGEFTMFCQNGKLTLYEMLFLAMGLLLWRKIFCDKIDTR